MKTIQIDDYNGRCAPCSGKSTLTRNIISELYSAEYVEFLKLLHHHVHVLMNVEKYELGGLEKVQGSVIELVSVFSSPSVFLWEVQGPL